jgi:hypothetical protein
MMDIGSIAATRRFAFDACEIVAPKNALSETLGRLSLASHEHQAVIRALGQSFMEFDRVDNRLVLGMIRIATVSCIYFRRSDEDEANRRAQKAKIDASIEAVRRWLAGELGEPDWPDIPPWHLRRRRSLRLPGFSVDEVDEDLEGEESTDALVDEQQLGELIGHLIRFATGGVPNWLVSLTKHLMGWTLAANGPTKDQRWKSDNRPTGWNRDFFDFVGVLSVALPHPEDVVTSTTRCARSRALRRPMDELHSTPREKVDEDGLSPAIRAAVAELRAKYCWIGSPGFPAAR